MIEDRSAVERSKRTPAALFDELNWDYAVIERLSPDLSTQVIPFNLGKAVLQDDAASNVELMAGDVVTIYSQKDMRVPLARQTRLVAVEGEIGAPGVYQLQPGETLPQLIARAGGFTPQAYLYGLNSRARNTLKQRETSPRRWHAWSLGVARRVHVTLRTDVVTLLPIKALGERSATRRRCGLSRVRRTAHRAELEPNDTTAAPCPRCRWSMATG